MKATKEDLKELDRLLKRSDFLSVNQNAKKWVAKGMIVLAAPNALERRRVGFTVTKKLEKTSVGRNRMKRRLRAVAANIMPHGAQAGMDYVLIGRSETATRPFKELERDLRWCLEKMGYAGS